MTVVKSVLLGTAAGFVAVVGAQAADLPSKKAAPANYVKICDAYGAGFYFIPGTETCLKVGGFVRVDYQYTPGKNIRSTAGAGAVTQIAGNQDVLGQEIRGRIDMDARTSTAWGTAQAVVRVRVANTDGIRTLGNNNSSATVPNTVVSYAPAGNGSSALAMERAYIRFAGFSFGLGDDIFTTMPSVMYSSAPSAGFASGIKNLSYTAAFGGGFTASVQVASKTDYGNASNQAQFTYLHDFDTGLVVSGALRYTQTWGYLQVMGAFTSNSTSVLPLNANNLFSPAVTTGAWAIGAGAQFLLPMIAAGDSLSLWAAYAEGLNGLVGCNNYSTCSDAGNKRILGGIQGAAPNMILVNAAGGNTYRNTRSWAVQGIFTHYWTPSVRSNFTAGYNQFLAPTANATAGLQFGNQSLWMAAGNLVWSPVRQLDLGIELAYYQNKINLQNAPAAFVAAGSPGQSNSNWSVKTRVERTF